MPSQLNLYLHKLRRLRVDRARGTPAPHKPVLLLAVIDLIEQEEIKRNHIEPSPQLVETYINYWTQITNGLPRPYLPFFHLKTSGFWHLHAQHGQTETLAKTQQFKSMTQLASVVAFASFDDELFALLLQPDTREAIRQTIIDAHLSEHRAAIESVFQTNQQITDVAKLLEQQAEDKTVLNVPPSPVRSAAFRREIVRLYNYTCAACRLRIITLDGKTAVDAAHIIPFSESHDDNIGNGLALCKLHHWAFEYGLISIDDNFCLLVSDAFNEKGNSSMLLRNLNNKSILLPAQKLFFPALHAVRWHRANKFQLS